MKWLTSLFFVFVASIAFGATQVCHAVTSDSGEAAGYMCYDNLAFNKDGPNAGTFYANSDDSQQNDEEQTSWRSRLPFKVSFQIYQPEKIAMSPTNALFLEGDEAFERASIKITFPF